MKLTNVIEAMPVIFFGLMMSQHPFVFTDYLKEKWD